MCGVSMDLCGDLTGDKGGVEEGASTELDWVL